MHPPTSPLSIIKLSATGNDFLLVDLLSKKKRDIWKKEGIKKRAEMVAACCHRQEGLGADGMVFLEEKKGYDFAWDFYNSDGSSAEMCGNAARAVSLYASQTLKKKKLLFLSAVGPVEAIIKSANDIQVRLPKIAEEQWNQSFDFRGAQLPFDFLRAGVPHAVVSVPSLEDRASLKEMASVIKARPAFQKAGTNVTFVHAKGPLKIESVTYERGVEDFTLSCGTGAISAAYSILRGEENKTVEVRVPGGRLNVVWKQGCPYLKGPARIVAEMHLCR